MHVQRTLIHDLSAGPLLVEGSLSQFPGGEVEVSFDSDRSKANYQCVLLEQGSEPPTVIPCETIPLLLLTFGRKNGRNFWPTN